MRTCKSDAAPLEPPAGVLSRLRFFVSGGHSTADLQLDGTFAWVVRRSVTAGVEIRLNERMSLSVGAGALLGGALVRDVPGSAPLPGLRVRFPQEHWALDAGGLGTAAFSWQIAEERGAQPFVLGAVSAGAGYSEASRVLPSATSGSVFASDLRVSLLVGKTFGGVARPYIALRAFGGPLLLSTGGSTLLGGDRYHVQAAIGLSAALPRGLDVFAELAPGPERAVSVGAGFRP